MAAATAIVITAGAMTFGNEWYQTKKVDWKVPVATVLLAAGIDGIARLDTKAATMIAVAIFIGAANTKFNGRSVFDTLGQLEPGTPQRKTK